MEYNEIISALYSENTRLLDENKLDEALWLTNIIWSCDSIADPSHELVDRLNKVYAKAVIL